MVRPDYTGSRPPQASGQAKTPPPLPTLEDTLRLWRERTEAKGPLTVTAALSPVVFATPLGVKSDEYVSHVTNSYSLINAGRLVRAGIWEGRDLYRVSEEGRGA